MKALSTKFFGSSHSVCQPHAAFSFSRWARSARVNAKGNAERANTTRAAAAAAAKVVAVEVVVAIEAVVAAVVVAAEPE